MSGVLVRFSAGTFGLVWHQFGTDSGCRTYDQSIAQAGGGTRNRDKGFAYLRGRA